MPKYEVTRAWHGVNEGDVVELAKLHPALKANVRPIKGQAAELEPSTPAGTSENERKLDKGVIAKRLKELEIKFDGRSGADELATLLPEGELDKLFPAE